MKALTAFCFALIIFSVLGSNRAQGQMPCADLMKFGIYDKYQTFNSEFKYKQVKSFFSSYQFSTRQQAEAKAQEIGLDIKDVLNATYSGKSSTTDFQQWKQELLKSNYEEALTAGLTTQKVDKISSAITDLVKACLAEKGLHAYVIPSADGQNFTFTLDFSPSSAATPAAKGMFTITPSSVAASCAPGNLLNQQIEIGPQGISVSLKRLPTETVTLTYNTDQGSGVVRYDAMVNPKPTVSFTTQDVSIESGKSTKLTWDVQNAGGVEFVGQGQVTGTGNLTVTPPQSTQYQLKVTDLDGHQASTFVTVAVTPPPPVLTAAKVFFHTTNEDKDDDTNVSVNILFGGETIAAVSGTWGKFDDGSDHGWYPLNIIEKPKKSAMIGNSRFQLIEGPHGHDEWHFNWTIELTFSDNSTKRYDGPGNVDYDRTTITQPM